MIPPPPALSAPASARFDLLRLLLIAQVIGGHLALIAYPQIPGLDPSQLADLFAGGWRLAMRFGHEAAVVFVCMSGYFLAPRLVAAAQNEPGAQPVGSFIRARLHRIYPTLVAAIGLTIICDLLGHSLPGGVAFYRSGLGYDAVAALGWTSGLGNLLSLQPALSGAFGSNGPLWTLGYIVQFYLVGALLARLWRASPWLAWIALAAMLVASFVLYPPWGLFLACWLGCATVRWLPQGSSRKGWLALLAGGLCLAGANLLRSQAGIVLSGLAGALFLFGAAANLRPAIVEALGPSLVRLNAASFALYAFHFPLAVLVYVAVSPMFDQSGLAFRVVWPFLAVVPGLVLALVWQAGLDRLLNSGSSRR